MQMSDLSTGVLSDVFILLLSLASYPSPSTIAKLPFHRQTMMNTVTRFSTSTFGRGLLSRGLNNNPATTTRFFHATRLSALEERHGTTIVCVRKDGQVCMMGDGMVSAGSRIVKPNAVKIRRILPKNSYSGFTEEDEDASKKNGGTLVGFAGSTADAFTLLERLEGFLDEYPGQLSRSCVELAKGWRTDKYLRRLDAALLVADENISLELTGNGDVLESHDGVLGVGSGSTYAIGTF